MSARLSTTLLNWDHGAASQQGGRQDQQDRWGIFLTSNPDTLLAIVADGMGGHLDGALGAQIVLDVAQRFIQSPPELLRINPLAALEQLCQRMHEAINTQSETARSTVVMIWLNQEQGYWLNIGDSRLYHFRNNNRLMRTRDHSAAQLLMDLGEINESDMATHPEQTRLYRSLGGKEIPKSDNGHFSVINNDLIALCSDGVWEHVTEAELWETVFANDLTTAATSLTDLAVRRGGKMADNATLVLLRASTNADFAPCWLQRFSTSITSFFQSHRR